MGCPSCIFGRHTRPRLGTRCKRKGGSLGRRGTRGREASEIRGRLGCLEANGLRTRYLAVSACRTVGGLWIPFLDLMAMDPSEASGKGSAIPAPFNTDRNCVRRVVRGNTPSFGKVFNVSSCMLSRSSTSNYDKGSKRSCNSLCINLSRLFINSL
jgi:hypothetical protein